MRKRIVIIIFGILGIKDHSRAQSFLNGSFEINTAVTDQINLSNAAFTAMMANSVSFGSYGDLDIIQSATWGGGGAQNGTWYVGFTGGGTDICSAKLAAPLVAGTSYTISFYDRADGGFVPQPFQIGLSTLNNAFGTVIYTAPSSPVVNVWTNRIFSFVAPNNGQFITIQTLGALSNWSHVDNFTFINVLPIELISFNADCKNNQVILNWKTSTEKQNDHFSIERSDNAVDFRVIGTVKGAGNSFDTKSYTFLDETLAPMTTYYRLRQTDMCGNSSLSGIISTESCNSSANSIYNVAFDYSTGILNISSQKESPHYEVSFINGLAETVINQIVDSRIKSFDLNSLSSGVYLVRISSTEGVFTKKINKY